MITSLKPNEIFVFGSNTAGVHGSGAAKQARMSFGAKLGVGEGITGQCYAIPTLDGDSNGGLVLRKRSAGDLIESFITFFVTAALHPDKMFLLTKVGCGLAGYHEQYILALFQAAAFIFRSTEQDYDFPENVILPEGWAF